MDPALLGYLYAVASAFCNGSFGVLAKIPRIKNAKVSPYVFNLWTCVGVALSGLALWLVVPREFSALGVASGVMFVLSCGNSFLAIHLLDNVALATGVWCGTAMMVSFGSGVLSGDTITSVPMAAGAMGLLVGGVASISYIGMSAARLEAKASRGPPKPRDSEMGPLLPDEESPEEEASRMALVGGLCAAGAAGLLGGLLLTPMHFSRVQGVAYIPSMSLGVLLAAPLTLVLQALFPSGTMSATQLQVAAPPGVFAGLLWNAGNLASILAVQKLGLAVAYPIMQCGLFVGGIWGMVAFNELPSARHRIAFLAAGLALVAGATLLSLARDA